MQERDFGRSSCCYSNCSAAYPLRRAAGRIELLF